jgi:hypothetical protein
MIESSELIANSTLQDEASISTSDKDLLSLSSTWKSISDEITGDIKKL